MSAVFNRLLFVLMVVMSVSACKKDEKKEVKNDPIAPVASFKHTTDTTSWTVTFISTATNEPTTVEWDFGDGTTASGDSVTHSYDNPGEHIVTLTATNAIGTHTIKDTISLNERIIEISTTFGSMYLYLSNKTVKHRNNFFKLAAEGYFTGTTFHRIIPNFVIQGGDPNSKDDNPGNDGSGGPGYTIDFETDTAFTHDLGALGAASLKAKGPSSGSQFYIVVGNNVHNLDNSYVVFGRVIKGVDVAKTISTKPRNSSDRPNTNIPMTVTIHSKSKAEILTEYGYEVK